MSATSTGDVELLPFGSALFDRVINNFGLLRTPAKRSGPWPRRRAYLGREVASRSLFGVVRRSHLCFGIFPEAIGTHGTLDVGLPPAPPMFRFADETESIKVMHRAGFVDVAFGSVDATLEFVLDDLADFSGMHLSV